MPGTFFSPFVERNNVYVAATAGNTGRFPLGHYLILPDGRKYRFTRNDGTTEVAGSLYQAAVPVGNFTNLTADVARAVGATAISATLGSTSAAADLFTEGTAHTNNEAGEGYTYRIARAVAAAQANAAVVSAGIATVNLTAGETVQVALTGSSLVTFTQNKYSRVILQDAPPTSVLVGVSPGVAAANRYYWSQMKGEAAVLCRISLFAGHPVQADITTSGAIEQFKYRWHMSGANAADVTSFGFLQDASGSDTVLKAGAGVSSTTYDITGPIDSRSALVGICMIANATEEHALINLTNLE